MEITITGARIKIFDGDKEVVEKEVNAFLELYDNKSDGAYTPYPFATPMGGNRVMVTYYLTKDFSNEDKTT